MKILQIHNKYRQQGGEDVVYDAEKDLLENHGHTVIRYERNNKEIDEFSLFKKGTLLWATNWSKKSYAELNNLINKAKPDICHVHNFLPLISPSVYYACKHNKIPIVQTLHNYRLLCSNAYLFRNGKVCEECIGHSLYHSVKYGCYRGSKIQTFALARMVEKHKKRGTWKNIVDAYICLTEFTKKKFIQGGLPQNKLYVKPNFMHDFNKINSDRQDYFFSIGRLDETKGIKTLISAFRKFNSTKLKVAGTGPLAKLLSEETNNIEYIGQQQHSKILELLSRSIALVFPSVWYEGMPMSIVEAFAYSKPVIASRLGAMSEMIENGKTGLLFEPGSAEDLSQKIKWAYEHKEEMKQMGINARKVYEEKYTAERNYSLLMDIYKKAIENSKSNNVK